MIALVQYMWQFSKHADVSLLLHCRALEVGVRKCTVLDNRSPRCFVNKYVTFAVRGDQSNVKLVELFHSKGSSIIIIIFTSVHSVRWREGG